MQPARTYKQFHSGDRSNPVPHGMSSRPSPCPRNDASCGQVKRFFKRQGKCVVTFLGFSASGYDDAEAATNIAEGILSQYDPAKTIINGGATEEGIGFIYRLAKEHGFTTTGLVSTEAKRTGASMSRYVDRIFYIPDRRWGGYIEGTRKLSPVSGLTVQVSNHFYLLGGGEITAIEGDAARRLGKKVQFFPADMDHTAAINRAKKRNQPLPSHFKGAAFEIFSGQTALDIAPPSR